MSRTFSMKNKARNIISMFLILAFCISTIALPSSNAHTPAWEISTYAMMVAAPNPVGVGQPTYISMWVGEPLPESLPHNTIRRSGYTLTITAPDNTVTTQKWDTIQDTTGIQFYTFTPTQAGTYTLKFDYAGQKYIWNRANTPTLSASAALYENDTYLASSRTITLTVQEEALPAPISSYPLPTEYWTRPIEAQNTDWWTISSNWLGQPYINERIQPYGSAPNSPHIMWSKPLDAGGVVGGMYDETEGEQFYMGESYDSRWQSPLIINGIMYYSLPLQGSRTGGGYVAVDLHTGEEIWRNDQMGYTGSGVNVPSFGYLMSVDSANQHGVIPTGILFSSNFAQGFDAMTGKWIYNVTGVPNGATIAGPKGEILRYVYTSSTRTLAQWNSSRMWVWGWSNEGGKTPAYGVTLNGTLDYQTKQSCYDWTVTLPNLGPGTWSVANVGYQSMANPAVSLDNVLFMMQTENYGRGWTSANITAISLKPSSRGTIMWQKTINSAKPYVQGMFTTWDPEMGVFVTYDRDTMQYNGYSIADGNHLWGPITNPSNDYDWFTSGAGGRGEAISAYGNIYSAGYGGILSCWDIKTGKLKWTYGNGGPGNSTFDVQQPWGYRPIWQSAVADGKIYSLSTEHSPNTPMYKDALVRCINATTGEEIWTLMGWSTGMAAQNGAIVADGYLAFANTYDMKVYVIGKGPSSTTVSAGPKSTTLGQSVVIEGKVLDMAAGTKQQEQAARFPDGVPAVSDESMGRWMEYVYMQKPRPTDTVGVPVTISIVDANGNYREIGTVNSDADGFYSLNWAPDIEGKYTVYASFGGSESYWPSHAITSFAVDPAAATPAPPQEPITTMADTYLLPGIIAIIIAIAVGFAVTILVLRKRP